MWSQEIIQETCIALCNTYMSHMDSHSSLLILNHEQCWTAAWDNTIIRNA